MRISELLNEIMGKYWELGYTVEEIDLPLEWKEELDKEWPNNKTTDIHECAFGTIKVFPSQSRRLVVCVETKA